MERRFRAIWQCISNKPADQQSARPAAPNDTNRTRSPNHVLRVLADFPYLIYYLYDGNGEEIESAFITKDVEGKTEIFLADMDNILEASPKYQHLLSVVDGKEEGGYQQHDKLIVGSAFPMSIFLIKSSLENDVENFIVEGFIAEDTITQRN